MANKLFFKTVYLFLSHSQIYRKIFYLMIHSPSGYNGQSCVDPQAGAWSLFQVSHVGAGFQGFGLSSTAFPDNKQGAGWEVELLGLELTPIWDPGTCRARTLTARLLCRTLLVSF